ncbi:GxxExxY protein [Patescibacteria group bacterium]|nr:GxxExxY protein [Patescibacteria group bacterium]MBU2258986.1 GxxExxY protein [Patescibacteria group bacterium]
MSDYKYSDLTQRIIGCAMRVHNELGNGFQEVIYQRALAQEMFSADIEFARELPMTIMYKGKDIGERRADFLVEEKVMVELKAITRIEDVHFSQAINYLEAYKLEVGLLINFGSKRLEFRRFANTLKETSATSA